MEKQKTVPGIKSEVIGNLISSDLKEIFRKYLSGDDKAMISQQTRVGYHTVDKVLSGANPLTDNNSRTLIPAIKFAIEKLAVEMERAKAAQNKLGSMLKEKI